jgi:hypothetical protein
MMNGTPGRRVCHGRGLHQGDLLSPLLFLLVMEVLSALIRKADDWALFNQLGVNAITHRSSLYVDNMILLISPLATDLQLVRGIF